MKQFKTPTELSKMFLPQHFSRYPLVEIPQEFYDQRGSIRNIADGNLGDVAIIECEEGSIRANHIHEKDWHLTYLISGSMDYYWANSLTEKKFEKLELSAGQLVLTMAKEPHKMVFKEKSCFVAVSAVSRLQENYEIDTMKLSDDFF